VAIVVSKMKISDLKAAQSLYYLSNRLLC